jgi:SCY1-like protein 1
MALAATVDVFGEEDCATRLLPALCPLLLDKEKLALF